MSPETKQSEKSLVSRFNEANFGDAFLGTIRPVPPGG
jgi:hypothetical protein